MGAWHQCSPGFSSEQRQITGFAGLFSGAMVGVTGQELLGAVDLLGQHDPRERMGPGLDAKGDGFLGAGQKVRRQFRIAHRIRVARPRALDRPGLDGASAEAEELLGRGGEQGAIAERTASACA